MLVSRTTFSTSLPHPPDDPTHILFDFLGGEIGKTGADFVNHFEPGPAFRNQVLVHLDGNDGCHGA
ncbi:MAG: hypothetical protein ABIG67_06380, partial [Pseudomonadota bacterium]